LGSGVALEAKDVSPVPELKVGVVVVSTTQCLERVIERASVSLALRFVKVEKVGQ
jgi:hypothetical protein